MSVVSVASPHAGGRTRGMAALIVPPRTGPWVLSSSSLPTSAAFPSPTASGPTLMPRPPSTSQWMRGYVPRPCRTMRNAPLPPPWHTAPTSPMRVAPPLPPSPRSPPRGAPSRRASTIASCPPPCIASRPVSIRLRWPLSSMPLGGSTQLWWLVSSLASLWLVTSPTRASTAPSSLPPRRPSISRCSRPSIPRYRFGTATSTNASPHVGGARTPNAPPTPPSPPRPPKRSPKASWSAPTSPRPLSTMRCRGSGRSTRGPRPSRGS
jgi:hypothetical protein